MSRRAAGTIATATVLFLSRAEDRQMEGTCPCTLDGDGGAGDRWRANRALVPTSVAGDAGDKIMVIAADDKTRTPRDSSSGPPTTRALSSGRDAARQSEIVSFPSDDGYH